MNDIENNDRTIKTTSSETALESPEQIASEVEESEQFQQNETEQSTIENLPAIRNWKTSILFSLLGFLTSSFVVWMALVSLIGLLILNYLGDAARAFDTSVYGSIAGMSASVVTNVLTIIYSLVFYKSYYTEKPRLKSNKAISFCNFLFGNVIFGCLWNGNLTRSHILKRKEMGSSYKVAVVLSAIWICYACFTIFTNDIPLLQQAKSYSDESAQSQIQTSSPAPANSSSTKLVDSAIFSIDFPTEPTYESSDEPGFNTETYTAKTDDCYVLVAVDHVTLDLENENPYDYAATLTYSFLNNTVNTSVDENDIEKGTLDGYPAGYISLDSEDGESTVFATSILGDEYVLDLFVKANSKQRLDEIVNSFSLKSPKEANIEDYVAESAGFSIAFPGAPKYDSKTEEAYGYEVTSESWYEETNSGMYFVTCLTIPSDYPGLDNIDAINGGLSSSLLNLCANFDVPTENADIQYDEFLECPSAHTTFDFEGYKIMGRSFMKDDKAYTVVAGTSTQEQSESFINSFKFI